MSITDVFDKGRAYGFIQPGLVINFSHLTRLVEQADRRRAEEEEAWEEQEAQERAEARAWSNVYERNDRAREEDEREIARADSLGLWPYAH